MMSDATIHVNQAADAITSFHDSNHDSENGTIRVCSAMYGTKTGVNWWKQVAEGASIADIQNKWKATGARIRPSALIKCIQTFEKLVSALVCTEQKFDMDPAKEAHEVALTCIDQLMATVADGCILAALADPSHSKAQKITACRAKHTEHIKGKPTVEKLVCPQIKLYLYQVLDGVALNLDGVEQSPAAKAKAK